MALTKVPSSMQAVPFRKNLIINGSMQISQRETSFVGISNADYTLDRWQMGIVTSGVVNVGQVLSYTATAPIRYYLKTTVTTADTSIAASDLLYAQTKVEGFNVAHLKYGLSTAKTITLGFWHGHTPAGTYCIALRNNTFDRSYVAEYTQKVAGAWEFTEITIPGDTTGTWDHEEVIGIAVSFAQASGSTFHGTADTWQAGNFIATSNQVNGLGVISDALRIGDVQLELGSEATEMEYLSFGEELALCQRYYEKSYNYDINPGTVTDVGREFVFSQTTTAIQHVLTVRFKVSKRGTPNITPYSPDTADKPDFLEATGVDKATTVLGASNNGCLIILTSAFASTVGGTISAQWTASSEL